jgi:hypothetical protein
VLRRAAVQQVVVAAHDGSRWMSPPSAAELLPTNAAL